MPPRSPRRKASAGADLTLAWVKPAQQNRSRDTHARIVAAAERLLEGGRAWADLSVAELVAEADASVGAFYHRFKDKDALLHVLQIELYAQGAATAARAHALGAQAAPLDALVRAFVTLAIASYRDQRGLRRALLVEMCTQPAFRDRATELTRLTCDGLVTAIAPRVRTRGTEKVATAIDVCHRLIYGVLDQQLLYDDRSPTGRRLADAQLADELTVACVGYLERSLPFR